MRLLLPPSETKRDGTSGHPLLLNDLVAPELARDRERLLAALAKYCAIPSPKVRAAIGTTINQDAELLRNAAILTAPASPACEIYDGVLFDAIDLPSCRATTRARIVERSLVQSALFGVLGFGDAIPAYRCSADSALPRIGRLGTFWRKRLETVMPQLLDGHVLIDLRSGSYASMWTPKGAVAERTATVKVMEMRGGRRLAVSHMNKATKGRLVRALCDSRSEPRSIAAAAEAVAAAGYDVALELVHGRQVLEVLALEPTGAEVPRTASRSANSG